jgi:uncharacterized protein
MNMQSVMKFCLIAALLIFSSSHKLCFADKAVSYPEYENIYVNDYANILDSEHKRALTQYLQQAGFNNGPQITLLIIKSLSIYAPDTKLEPFATGLFNHWGIGNAATNDGVLILVSIQDRKMRIELGSGYSQNQNQVMKDIIDDSFIPYFKDGDYPAGIKIGTMDTIHKITGNYPGEFGYSFYTKTKSKVTRWVDKLGAWVFAIIAPIFMLIITGVRKLWRLRPRSCNACQHKMVMLDEQTDDEHIDGGQRLEEYLGSVDYDVWHCAACLRIDIYRYQSFFGSHSTCKNCNYRTLEADTTILESATTSHEGLKRIDYHCQNCNFRDTETRTTPRKNESSSSGSSSSFGGGSSSGGGASGSW